MNYVYTLLLQKLGITVALKEQVKGGTGRGKKYHIDTYTHPAVLQR